MRRLRYLLLSLLATTAVAAVATATASALPNNAIDGVNNGLQSRSEAQVGILASHIGVHLRFHLKVGWAHSDHDVTTALTGTNESLNGNIDRNGPICQIAVNKHFFQRIGSSYEENEVLLHEVFHCFEYSITSASHDDNDWVMEGLARWADLTIYPNTHFAVALKSLTEYYATPQKTVFRRSYDAVGFWAHLQDSSGGQLWHRIPAIIKGDVGGDDKRAMADALGSDETTVLQSWGSSAFDLAAGPTPYWRMVSPLAGRDHPSSHAPDVVDSSSTITLAPWSTSQLQINPGAAGPLIMVHLDQAVHGRFGLSEGYTDSDISSKLFCSATNPAECKCPVGDTGAVPPTTPLPGDPDLGVAADGTGGNVTVTYLSIASGGWCTPEKPPPPPGGVSCKGLLPGYNTSLEGEFASLLGSFGGSPPATEQEINGTYTSFCFFAGYLGSIQSLVNKETEAEELKIRQEMEEEGIPPGPYEPPAPEKVFVGSIATAVFTERAASVALAEKDYKIRASAFGGSPAGVGEESEINTIPEEENKQYGFNECGTEAVVRVKNVVAAFVIGGESGLDCGATAQALLGAVAAKL